MLLAIWLWSATIGMGLLIAGIVLDKNPFTKVILLGLDIPFLIIAAMSSMQIRVTGAGSTAIVEQTFYYPEFGIFFSVLLSITALLIIQQAFTGLAEEVKNL